jgi:uncharacterized damage-inducible protein DinB
MYRTIQDFQGAWSYEAEVTSKVFQALTDESLSQRIYPGGRTLGRIAWHIAQTLPEMCGRTGLDVVGPAEDAPVPASAAEIAKAFEEAADSLARQIQEKWTDTDLEVEDDMYGEMWKRGQTLGALVGHQAHHRGQMTVLMRQAGLKVPGVYGPSREEWADFGMPAPE